MNGSTGTSAKSEEVVITPRDILFECPACGKSLVVDEAAEGMIVECPQCHTNVIVPPKPTAGAPAAPAKSAPAKPEAPQPPPSSATGLPAAAMVEKLTKLTDQMKELQAQRTEISNRIGSRLNDLNRDLVLLARLETSQQQILSEWKQLLQQLAGAEAGRSAPTVLGSSVSRPGPSRVSFGG
jgi:DNA-directed RNA polymerase subunit RPC12/RpoP